MQLLKINLGSSDCSTIAAQLNLSSTNAAQLISNGPDPGFQSGVANFMNTQVHKVKIIYVGEGMEKALSVENLSEIFLHATLLKLDI